jgi:hypothetical protein
MPIAALFLSIFFLCAAIHAETNTFGDQGDLLRDLLTVEEINQRINDRLPVFYNHLLQGGYISMPSARMGQAGEIGIGYSYVPPYRLWNLRCQPLDRLEISGNYRIFHGVDDPVLTPFGFGDFADKGANIKVALLLPEESDYRLPGFAIGLEDFTGTRAFKAGYIVFTKVFIEGNLEVSIGYGKKRIHGFFGGVHWMPLRHSRWRYLQNLVFTAEYDATPYTFSHLEPHPEGRVKRLDFNFGLKYRLWDLFDFSLSYIRGDAWAFSVSGSYNLGTTKGLVPKIDDPLPYRAPVNLEPLGALRNEKVLVQDLVYAFRAQGFDIIESWLTYDDCGDKTLRLRIMNNIYRLECEAKKRLNSLIAYLIPLNISLVIIEIDCEGMLIQEYRYKMPYARAYAAGEIGEAELNVLSPMTEATFPNPCADWLLFKKDYELFCPELLPKSYSYFGSSRGKFKYAVGLQAVTSGFFPGEIFYSAVIGCLPWGNIGKLSDFDRLNPSQLINVRTGIIRYIQQKGITLDEAYLQKAWNVSTSLYARLSAGYFEVDYAGVAGELLYYPVHSRLAFGLDGAILKRRKVGSWLGFTNKIRRLHGFTPTYHKFLGSQFFFNVYWEWPEAKVDLRLKMGKFLANDWGIRYELSRYFESGLRLTVWYTRTNGHDRINGKTYYDKGIEFTMPLDMFYTNADRSVWGYGMSAWLRDVGISGFTGQELYYLINDQR